MGKLIRAVLRGQDDGNIIPLPDHHSRSLQVPENIRLIAQPAHSPEVNPVEHLWEEVREKYLHNWAFSSLDLLEERLCQGLNAITDDSELVRSLMGFPHLNVLV